MYMYMYIIYVYREVWADSCVCVCICTHTCICMYIYICICICILHMYTGKFGRTASADEPGPGLARIASAGLYLFISCSVYCGYGTVYMGCVGIAQCIWEYRYTGYTGI